MAFNLFLSCQQNFKKLVQISTKLPIHAKLQVVLFSYKFFILFIIPYIIILYIIPRYWAESLVLHIHPLLCHAITPIIAATNVIFSFSYATSLNSVIAVIKTLFCPN